MKDLSMTFNRNRFTSDVGQLNKRQAIKQKIFTILNLSPGDIVYKDYVFSGFKRMLGESISNVNCSIMKEIIHLAMTRFVPEVEFVDAKITPDYDKQVYRIKIYYYESTETELVNVDLVVKTTN